MLRRALLPSCRPRRAERASPAGGRLPLVRAQDKWLNDDANFAKWSGGKIPISERRILMTHWAGEAWDAVCTDHQQARRPAHPSVRLL